LRKRPTRRLPALHRPAVKNACREIPHLFNKKHPLHSRIETLMQYAPLIEIIEMFWLEQKNRQASSWTAHRDINMVMLATSLAPDGYLTL
jgi:hypothetical protein